MAMAGRVHRFDGLHVALAFLVVVALIFGVLDYEIEVRGA